jgi:uncharacterized protein YecE (DUF72 family)
MGSILVGTSSWTDPTLLRSGWYPRGVNTPEKKLRFYSLNFPIVEVDSAYYALPSRDTVRLWVERTPPEFVFDVKAFALFTQHPTPVRSLPQDIQMALPEKLRQRASLYQKDVSADLAGEIWRRFVDALLPLDSAGKLGVVLFQFPQWFLPGSETCEYILRCGEMMGQYRIGVEFRSSVWLAEKNMKATLGFLRDNSLPFVCVDEPQGFRSSVPPVAEVTSDIGIVRFHGRNRETWEKKGVTAAERFDYLYSVDELSEWVPKIKAMSEKAQVMHVLFNNCCGDKGVRNARDMDILLKGGQPPLTKDSIQPLLYM